MIWNIDFEDEVIIGATRAIVSKTIEEAKYWCNESNASFITLNALAIRIIDAPPYSTIVVDAPDIQEAIKLSLLFKNL